MLPFVLFAYCHSCSERGAFLDKSRGKPPELFDEDVADLARLFAHDRVARLGAQRTAKMQKGFVGHQDGRKARSATFCLPAIFRSILWGCVLSLICGKGISNFNILSR